MDNMIPAGYQVVSQPKPTGLPEGYEVVQQPDQGMTWPQAAMSAVEHLPESAARFGGDIIQPFLHPIDTGKSLAALGNGIIQKLIPGEHPDEATADAVGKFFMDRYGNSEGIKKTLATDPVGMLGDVASVLTGVGGVAARAPGMIGRVGVAAQKAGALVDPLTATVRGGKLAGKLVGKTAAGGLGLATGAGGRAITEAAQAGAEGGRRADSFLSHMRGTSPVDDIVTDARTALANLRAQRGAQYRQGMAGVAADNTVLNFDGIDRAINDVAGVGSYKGQPIRQSTAGVMDELRKAVDEWKALDPAEFHTAEGLDALKQKIYDIGKKHDPMTQAQSRMVADQVYNAIKAEIVKQAPEYAEVMKGYERGSNLIGDIEKTLSVNPKASIDTATRKLQSVIRDNVNTNYGRRVDLAEVLAQNGAPDLFPKIAGQALSSNTPRGIQGAIAIPTALGLMASGNPAAVLSMALTSPRIVGEGAYYAGKAGGKAQSLVERLLQNQLTGRMSPEVSRILGQEAFQAGRISDEDQRRLAQRLTGR
jgi:hypothetical protein